MEPHPRVVASLEEAAANFNGEAVKERREEASTPAQVGEIKERPIKTRRVAAFKTTANGFPSVKDSAADVSIQALKSKSASGSIFAMAMTETLAPPLRYIEPSETVNEVHATFNDDEEARQIDEENRRRIETMTTQEIESAQAELLERFDPKILAAIANRKSKSTKRKVRASEENEETPVKDLGWVRTESDLKTALKTKATKSERLKVQWMLEEEQNENESTLTIADAGESEPRFDLQGEFVTPDKEFRNELYHHGGPNVAGYTVSELVHLSRSTVAQQRAMALKALAGLFRRRASDLKPFAKVVVNQSETLIALRMALDQESPSALAPAIEALHAFICPPLSWERERLTSLGFGLGHVGWGVIMRAQGAPTHPPSPAREIFMTRDEEQVEETGDEESRLDDAELAESSPVRFLIRSNFITRVGFLVVHRLAEVPDESVKRLLEMVSFLIRARPHTVEEEMPTLTMLLGFLFDSKRFLEATLDMLLSILTYTDVNPAVDLASLVKLNLNMKTLSLVVFCFRAMFLRQYSLDKFETIFPLLASRVEEAIEDQVEGEAMEFVCGVFDLARVYCEKKRSNETFQQLSSFAVFASRVAASLFSVVGTKVCSAAIRFVGALLACYIPDNSSSFEWALGQLVIPSRTKQTIDQEDHIVDQMMMAVLIFAGHALHILEGMEDNIVALDAVRSSVLALTSLALSPSIRSQLVNASTVWESLWKQLGSLDQIKPTRTLEKPPLSPLQGLLQLTRDQVFMYSLKFFCLIKDDPLVSSTLSWSQPAIKTLICEYVSGQYGSYGFKENDALLLELIGALATPAMTAFPDSHTCLEVRDALLSGVSTLAISRDDLIAARDDKLYRTWTRFAPAWPAIFILASETKDLNRTYIEANLLFCLGLKCIPCEAVMSALCLLAVKAPGDMLSDEEIISYACKWFDQSVSSSQTELRAKASRGIVSEVLLRFVGGKEKARQLAQDLAQKMVEESFGNAMLGRCLTFLLSPLSPSVARVSAWKILERGKGLAILPDVGAVLFPLEWEETDEEMLELIGQAVEFVEEGGWIGQRFILPQIKSLLGGPRQTKWIAKRLKERLELARPDLIQILQEV